MIEFLIFAGWVVLGAVCIAVTVTVICLCYAAKEVFKEELEEEENQYNN